MTNNMLQINNNEQNLLSNINQNMVSKEMLKEIYAKDATDEELKMFLLICNTRGLSPVLNQIYFVKMWDSNLQKDKMSAVVSIEGMRLVSERSGLYEGQTRIEWCGKDGKWLDIWTKDEPPFAARVGIYKKGFREPIYRHAEWKSFVKTTKNGEPNSFWKKFGTHMLAKCAEGLAHRAAISDCSGLYLREEMDHAIIDVQKEQIKNIEQIQIDNNKKQDLEHEKNVREKLKQDIAFWCKRDPQVSILDEDMKKKFYFSLWEKVFKMYMNNEEVMLDEYFYATKEELNIGVL